MKRLWFPEIHQVFIGPSNGYFHSLFVGLTAPFLNLPQMIWNMVMMPMFYGIWMILSFAVMTVLAGLAGRAQGLNFGEIADSERNVG